MITPIARAAVPLLFCLAAGCNGRDSLNGSGTMTTESRDVHGFTAITLAGEGDLTLTQGPTESLTVEGDDNILPSVTTTVSGGRLTIATRGRVHPSRTLRYTLTMRELTSIDLSGSGSVTGQNIDARALEVRVSGAGTVTLAGHADTQDVTLSGAGAYEAANLATGTAVVSMSGVGASVVQAKDVLRVSITGMGKLEYIGDPKVTQSVTGLGSVKKH